jgi:hypothetical protein
MCCAERQHRSLRYLRYERQVSSRRLIAACRAGCPFHRVHVAPCSRDFGAAHRRHVHTALRRLRLCRTAVLAEPNPQHHGFSVAELYEPVCGASGNCDQDPLTGGVDSPTSWHPAHVCLVLRSGARMGDVCCITATHHPSLLGAGFLKFLAGGRTTEVTRVLRDRENGKGRSLPPRRRDESARPEL